MCSVLAVAVWSTGSLPCLVQSGHPPQRHALHRHTNQHAVQHLPHVCGSRVSACAPHHLLCPALLHAVCEGIEFRGMLYTTMYVSIVLYYHSMFLFVPTSVYTSFSLLCMSAICVGVPMVVSLQGRSDTLTAFLNPSRAVAKTVMQTVGELDFETIFNDGNLLYSPSAYLLFFTFVVVMPVLFSNLLVCSQSIMHLVAYAWIDEQCEACVCIRTHVFSQ